MAATRATELAVRKTSRPRRDRGCPRSVIAARGSAMAVIGSLGVRRPDRNGACCASSRRTVPDRHGAPPWRGEPAGHVPVNPGHTKAEMAYLRSVHHQNRSVGGRHACPYRLPQAAGVPPAVTAVLSDDGRRILFPDADAARPRPGPRSAAVLDRCVGRENGVSLAGAHPDALGLYVRCLGHQDLQHAVLRRGLDLVRLDVAGQGDRAAEGAVIDAQPGASSPRRSRARSAAPPGSSAGRPRR